MLLFHRLSKIRKFNKILNNTQTLQLTNKLNTTNVSLNRYRYSHRKIHHSKSFLYYKNKKTLWENIVEHHFCLSIVNMACVQMVTISTYAINPKED